MNSIIRGTTPTIQYTFKSVNVANITTAYLTIKMSGATLIEKDITSATVGQKSLSWMLSQAETLSMTASEVIIQLNWKLNDGTRGASLKTRMTISDNVKEVVI